MAKDETTVRSPAAGGAFGPNAWLVDDMFEEYRVDPSSVSESWREFFADYVPGGAGTAAVSAPPPASGAEPVSDDGRSGSGSTAMATQAPGSAPGSGVSTSAA